MKNVERCQSPETVRSVLFEKRSSTLDVAVVNPPKIQCVIFEHLINGSHITLQPKTGCPLKLSRVETGQYLDGRPPEKTRLLLEEVLVRPAGGAHPVVCVGPNAPV